VPEPRDPLRAPVLVPGLAAMAAVTAAAGLRIGHPWILPVLEAAPAWLVMIRLVAAGRRAAAVLSMLWWAFCLGVSMTILCAVDPWGTATGAVVHGSAYFQEMRAWAETGIGCESSPACFIPVHATHAGAFVLLALATASAGALLLGAVLMNYMAYFVGSLASGAVDPIGVALVSWFPWSLARIASFVTLGAVLSEPLLFRLTGRAAPPRRRVWIAAAAAGLILDVALKTWLAPKWPPILRLLLHG